MQLTLSWVPETRTITQIKDREVWQELKGGFLRGRKIVTSLLTFVF